MKGWFIINHDDSILQPLQLRSHLLNRDEELTVVVMYNNRPATKLYLPSGIATRHSRVQECKEPSL